MCLPFDEYDKSINKYGVKCGSTLEQWEASAWISKYDPYGWVQWYCEFYSGRGCPDDERQIKGWANIKMRFGKQKKKTLKIGQTLLHWAIA